MPTSTYTLKLIPVDIENPRGKQDFERLPPEQLVEDIVKKKQRILEIMEEIKKVLAQGKP